MEGQKADIRNKVLPGRVGEVAVDFWFLLVLNVSPDSSSSMRLPEGK